MLVFIVDVCVSVQMIFAFSKEMKIELEKDQGEATNLAMEC